MEIAIGVIFLIVSPFWDISTLAVKISGATIPLTSTRFLENKSSYANVAEKVLASLDVSTKLDEDLLLAKIHNRDLDEPCNDATVLPAAYDYFTKDIYSIGKELQDYGISASSEVWTISSSAGVIEYLIGKHVGNGTFGEAKFALPVGKSSIDDVVVIKTEKNGIRKGVLENEKEMYNELTGVVGIPEVGGFGDFGKQGSVEKASHGMPVQLLGASLDKLQYLCGGKFSLPTVAVIAIQMLERLRAIHGKMILHRDIKPSNICINRLLHSRVPRIFNLIDFGFSKKFSLDIRIGISAIDGESEIGSPWFMSRSCHRSKLHGPKDDLQSLAYTLIYLLTGSLPWCKFRDLDDMIENKNRTPVSEVCKDIPAEFCEFLEYADQEPNPFMPIEYEKYIAKFRKVLTKLGLHESRVEFDWEFKIRMLYEFRDTQSVGVAYTKQKTNWLVVFAFKKYPIPNLFDEAFEVAQIYAERHYTQNIVERSPEQIIVQYYVKPEQNMICEFHNLLDDSTHRLKSHMTQSLLFNIWSFVAFGFACDPKTGDLFVAILISKAALPVSNFDQMVSYDDAQYSSLQLSETARNMVIGRTVASKTGFTLDGYLSKYAIRIKSKSPIDSLKALKTMPGHGWGSDPDIIEFGFSIIQVDNDLFDLIIIGAKFYMRAIHNLKVYNLPLTIFRDDRTNTVKVREFEKRWKVDRVDSGLIQIVLELAHSLPPHQIGQVRVGWTHENGNLVVATAMNKHLFHGFILSGKGFAKSYKCPDVRLVWKAETEASDPEIGNRISPENNEISMQPVLVQQEYEGDLESMIYAILNEMTSLAVGCAISSTNMLTVIVYPVYTYYYRAIKIINLKRENTLTIFYTNDKLKDFVVGTKQSSPMLGTYNFTRTEPVEVGNFAEDTILHSCVEKLLKEKESNNYKELMKSEVKEIGFVISQPKPNECEIFISLYQASDIQAIQMEPLEFRKRR